MGLHGGERLHLASAAGVGGVEVPLGQRELAAQSNSRN